MVPTFFETAVEDHREKWQTWLNDTVSKKPFDIEADTADMGLASVVWRKRCRTRPTEF